MKVNFKELRKDWETKFKEGCKNLDGDLCNCFKKDHYAFGEEPIKCNMHKCPDFKPKLDQAMGKLGLVNSGVLIEKEKVAQKEKEIEVDKI